MYLSLDLDLTHNKFRTESHIVCSKDQMYVFSNKTTDKILGFLPLELMVNKSIKSEKSGVLGWLYLIS